MTAARRNFFAIAQPGLEGVLEAECGRLDVQSHAVAGGVVFEGPPALGWEANLRLRTATRILQRIVDTEASSPSALEKVLRSLSWGEWLSGTSGSVVLHTSGFGAWPVERMFEQATRLKVRTQSDNSEETESSGDALGVWARLSSGRFTCAIDTSGHLLYRRGYRQEISRAPLRETLAAGLLLLAGYDGSEPLCDPLCGSGTFLIEAAWMAMRRAPGLGQSFAFQRFPHFDARAYAALEAKIAEERLSQPAHGIFGSDIHAGALGTARRNAKRAQVVEHLSLERKDVLALDAPQGPPGILVGNLPYGIRVGDRTELQGFHRKLGERLRRAFRGWRAAFLVADAQFEHQAGLKVQSVHPLSNGGIPTRWVISQHIA